MTSNDKNLGVKSVFEDVRHKPVSKEFEGSKIIKIKLDLLECCNLLIFN